MQGSSLDVPLDGALALYGLKAAQVFREPAQDSKALVAWGSDTVVVTFRGTASFVNVLHDIKVRVNAVFFAAGAQPMLMHTSPNAVCSANKVWRSPVLVSARLGKLFTRRSGAWFGTTPSRGFTGDF